MKHIVKRHGHTELFDDRKIYASIFASCLAVREPIGSAELIAEKVVTDISSWIEQKHEVTSNDIRAQAGKHLQVYQPDAAYMYTHHRLVS